MTFERREKSELNGFNVWQKGHPFNPFCGQKSPPPVSGCFHIHHGRQPFQYFADGTILPLSIEKSKPLSILKLHFLNFQKAQH
jgi:hypothetical protein